MHDPNLTLGDVATLWAILDRVNDDGISWPGYGRLAEDTGFHRATIGRAIGKLIAGDYLECESGGPGKSNRYRPGSRKHAPTTRRTYATGSRDADRRTDATGVGAHVRLGVGAPVRPEPASLNLLKEPAPRVRAKKPEIILPTWLPADAWQAWKDHRGKKFSAKAQKLGIAKLETLRGEGHDPARLIDLAIESGWSSFYSRDSTRTGQHRPAAGAIERDQRSEAEIEAENAAQLARFGMGEAA